MSRVTESGASHPYREVLIMIRSVTLPELPAGLHFPPELRERIAYDANTRQLRFDGYMSKTHFDKLIRLDKSDAYRRAIEDLFQICEFETDSGFKPCRVIVPVAIGLLVLAACAGVVFVIAL